MENTTYNISTVASEDGEYRSFFLEVDGYMELLGSAEWAGSSGWEVQDRARVRVTFTETWEEALGFCLASRSR